MSRQTVNQVIQKAISDAAFRRQLQRDPAGALAGFELTADERSAITSGDPTRLTALGVDQRMSKAFGLGGVSDLSKTVVGDPGSAGSAAFIDEASAAGTSGLIGQDASDSGTAAMIANDGGIAANAAVTGDDASSSAVIVGDPGAAAPHMFETPDGARLDPGYVGGSAASASASVGEIDTTGDLNVIDPGLTGGTTPGTESVTEGTQVEDLNQGY